MEESKFKRLTPREWAEAAALWESGEVTLDDLSARFKVARETFSRKFTKEGLVKGAKASMHADKVRAEVAKAIHGDALLLAERIRNAKEQHHDWAAALARLTMNEIAKCNTERRSFATAKPALLAIESAMKILAMAREERWATLGLNANDDPNDVDLPELSIKEMSARDVAKQREKSIDAALGITAETNLSDLTDEGELGADDIVEEGKSGGE